MSEEFPASSSMGALILGQDERKLIQALIALAQSNPVDMQAVVKVNTEAQAKAHMQQMLAQTIDIPTCYRVTFTIEHGHPGALWARHMSMSTTRSDRVPNPSALWMVAEEFGFTGSLEHCVVYHEEYEKGCFAINVVQPIETDQTSNQKG